MAHSQAAQVENLLFTIENEHLPQGTAEAIVRLVNRTNKTANQLYNLNKNPLPKIVQTKKELGTIQI